jgi:hypothetical protein
VLTDQIGELLAGALTAPFRLLDHPRDLAQRFAVALVENRFLVGKIMIERRLPYTEALGDVI